MVDGGYLDYFKILGVERNATPEAIKGAFRKLARQYHPDMNPGDSKAEEKFKKISEAYEVLSDPDKRRRYEQFGQYWNQAQGTNARDPFGAGFDGDFGRYGNFDEFINDLLGRFAGPGAPSGFGGGSPRNSKRSALNLDAEVTVTVSFSEAFHGTGRILSVNEERVEVRIPQGVKSGSRLRLKGKGNLQPGTGRRGDLYLNLQVQAHSIWRLEGNRLCADLPVAFDELILGGDITVITPDGEAKVVIPQGTRPGTSLRLKGKGWPLSDGRGDLIFTLVLELQSQLSKEEQHLLEKLKKLRCKNPRESWVKSARL